MAEAVKPLKYLVRIASDFKFPMRKNQPVKRNEKTGDHGVIHQRGKFQFTHENDREVECTYDDLIVFTRKKHRVFATDPVVFEFDPLYTIRPVLTPDIVKDICEKALQKFKGENAEREALRKAQG